MGKLDGKIAIVTGGTSGIGEATAIELAREGARVVIVGRNESNGERVCQKINKNGSESCFYKCNVCDSREVDGLKEYIEKEFKRIDIIVNSAGTWEPISLDKLTDDDWSRAIDSNATSVMYVTRAFESLLRASKGNIINVASIGGMQSHIAGTKQYAYGAAKAAAIQFSQLCALNFAPDVRVNVVCPGPTDTPIYTNKDYSRFYDSIPMHRVGKPEETAKAIAFLASEDASYITGTVLTVDGGASIK